ncbi:Ig-like domain-containing protein [Neobacillus drentensis]|uniref:Ig-like domain-containing protein n=1 Tax=Neobacillus drentensis TaxID=220684 RepID=UPI002FFDC872
MLEVKLSDHTKTFVSVTWDSISDNQISKENVFIINGTIEGTNKKAVAEITVKEDPNIALKKTATASSQQSSNTAATGSAIHSNTCKSWFHYGIRRWYIPCKS